jgi:ABC-type branched-subunit amino acid transport system substrate-binding protein
VLAIAAALSACAPAPRPIERVVVGASLPLSGSETAAGIALQQGYAKAVDEANAAGGLTLARFSRRVPVVLAVLNDRGEASVAERHVDALIARGAHVLLATHGAVRATAQALAAEHAGCPYVTNPVDAPGLPGSRMQWVVSVPASAGDAGTRAYESARSALALIERAGSPDRHAMRTLLATQ